MDPLLEKLKALGLIQASAVPEKQKKTTHKKFEEVIEGEEISNSLGTCYLTTSLYPWSYQHGKVLFEQRSDLSLISRAGKANEISNHDLSKLLFIDTETTGLSGGTGTFAFLVGLGYFTDEGFELKQYIIRDPTEEPAMLLEIANLVAHYTGIVSFNGKAFDIPLLKTRYLINRLKPPFDNLSHLDLLFLSRKLWKNRLKSRALQDLEQEILDIPRTSEEVPGWMIPEIYFAFLRSGNAEPLKGVVYHNGMDIVSLAALFLYISNSFDQISASEEIHPIDFFSIGQVFYDLNLLDMAQSIFTECIERTTLPSDMQLLSLKYLGTMYKRKEHYESAIIYWQKASDLNDIDSMIELAKYHEHSLRDPAAALTWTESASAILAKTGYHNYQSRHLKKEIEKRRDRLSGKLEKDKANVSKKNS
jgi:uncharacterized protein YprB with RNaseH-like and TPR domain